MKAGSAPFNPQERDIDIILLEELHCNPAFVTWIAGKAGLQSGTLIAAKHSVYGDNGETDVLAVLDTPEGQVALLIEDKIGAAMQPKQAERYHLRGEQLCATEPEIKRYITLLCAPIAYIASTPIAEWHATVSLETISEWFGLRNDFRSNWRRDVLMHAIKRARRSILGADASQNIDPALVVFKKNYYEHMISRHPDFLATEQPGRDKEFHYKGLNFPAFISMKHRLIHSQVVLMFERQWIKSATCVLNQNLHDESMWITAHPSSLHLAIGVEAVDFTASFSEQIDLVELAVEAARRLLPYAALVQQSPLP